MNTELLIENKFCDFCFSEEGKHRLIGDYIVSLAKVDVNGDQQLACQSCRIKNDKIRKTLGLKPTYRELAKNRKQRSLLKFGFKP